MKTNTHYEEIDFIKTNLININKKFKEIKIEYAYDSASEFHIVEISPESIRKNKDFKKIERKLWKHFMERFVNSDLLICNPSSENNMDNLIFVI